jgi:hypothetical protein
MALSVDTRKIVRADVVPWESDEKLYGVAYLLQVGSEGADRIGTKAQAEKIVRDIAKQRGDALSAVLDRLHE